MIISFTNFHFSQKKLEAKELIGPDDGYSEDNEEDVSDDEEEGDE